MVFICFLQGCKVSAVDPNRSMESYALDNARQFGLQDFESVDGVAEELPFEDDSFDRAVCTLVVAQSYHQMPACVTDEGMQVDAGLRAILAGSADLAYPVCILVLSWYVSTCNDHHTPVAEVLPFSALVSGLL